MGAAEKTNGNANGNLKDAAPGELVAVDLPPGPAWLGVLVELWSAGVAFLPLHHMWSASERRSIVDLARPTWVLDGDGAHVFAGAPISPDIGAVVATSGSGGAPKLAELPRDALVTAVTASASTLGVSPSETWVACLSPAHVGGLLVLLRGAVLGSHLVFLERFDPERLLLEAPEGAFVSLVPTMIRGLVETGADLSKLGTLLVGGDALDPGLATVAAERGARIVQTYGLTETCGGISYDGELLAGTRVRFQGLESGIELKGPTVMEGYRSDPAATGAAFTVDGWLRTADAGEVGDDGRLLVKGRLDELIRTGAEKVWPEEVERALRDHPKVGDVAVAGRPDSEWGHQVVAFVVPRLVDDPPSLQELRDHAGERIARFKAPREIVLLPELPRSASGKLRRSALQGTST